MTNRSPLFKYLIILAVFLLLEGISVVLIARRGIFQQLRIAELWMDAGGWMQQKRGDIEYYFDLKDINMSLEEENTRLLNSLERYRTAVNDSLAAVSDSVKYSYITARIMGNSTNKKHNFLIIDKGKRDGITKDMGVISSDGVVGVVTAVSDNYSFVVSFLNINQSVSAIIDKTNSFGPLVWDGKSSQYALLTEIPQHIKFAIGDTVKTSGYSSLFPPEIPLGVIEDSKIVRGSQHEIKVKLFLDFNSLRFVRIVINRDKNEINQLLKEGNV